MSPSRQHLRPPLARRVLAAVLALGYLVAGVGLPVPHLPKPRAAGPGFACRGGECGCSTPGLAGGCCCSAPAKKPAAMSCCGTKPAPADGWNGPACDAAKCRGHGPADLLTPPPAVPPTAPVAAAVEAVEGEPLFLTSAVPPTIPVRPPVPPPRLV